MTAGPYYFAWADEGDAFDPVVHARFDDDIFEYELSQNEGDFATLSITIQNPRVGLLAPGRQIWAWFSHGEGSVITPLFFGRLVGLPDNIDGDTVVLNFIARPSDFAAQKLAYAQTLTVRPYWDSIWFDSTKPFDPDNVLESRPELWHTDRVTHVVTTSNIATGEDGTLSYDESQVFYDSVGVTYAQNPLRSVQMTAAVSWDQTGSGAASLPLGPGVTPGVIKSFTGEGLAAGWPKSGTSLGGGWSFSEASAVPSGMVPQALVGQVVYPNIPGDPFTHYADGGFDTSLGTWGKNADGTNIGWSYHVAIPNVSVKWTATLAWSVNRRKTETLTFTLNSDVQDILTLPDDGEVLALSMSSSELTAGIDPGGVAPLGTPLARGYFGTDRGAASIEFLIAVARANLIARARAVNVTFGIPFSLAVSSDISCRKNAVISDSRLPGGVAGGKISSYSFGLSGGVETAVMTIACTIGKDGAVTESRGDPDYCETDYVDGEIASSESPSSALVDLFYQSYTGRFSLPFASDIAYESILGAAVNDDGIDFTLNMGRYVTTELLGRNVNAEDQPGALADRFAITVDNGGQVTAVNISYAQLSVTVKDLTGGPFQTDYALNVTDLKIPRNINLEAPSLEAASS